MPTITPSSAPTEQVQDYGSGMAFAGMQISMFVGIVVGALIILCCLCLFLYFCCMTKNNESESAMEKWIKNHDPQSDIVNFNQPARPSSTYVSKDYNMYARNSSYVPPPPTFNPLSAQNAARAGLEKYENF